MEISVQRKFAIFAGLMLAVLLAALDQTIVSTALPKIVADLGGLEHYSWVASAYMLASTSTLPLYGKLSDILGRRPVFIFGISVFLIGSMLAGVSQTMLELVAFRAIQGIGAGAMLPLVIATVGDIIPPADRGKWQGLIGAMFGLASIVGPTAGGWIADNTTWRWVFYINLPLGAVALATVATTLKIPRQVREKAPIDFPGAITVSGGIVAGLLVTVWGGQTYPWNSWQIFTTAAISVLLLGSFILIERHAPDPILPLSLFKNSIFTISALASLIVGVGMFGTIIYIPLFVQGVIGTSATNSGVILTPLMLAVVTTSTVGGQLVSRTGRYKPVAVSGLAVMTLGMWLLTRLNVDSTNTEVVRDMIIIGAGLGGVMQIFILAVQNSVSRREMGVAVSASTFFRQIGGTIGITVLGALLTHELTVNIPRNLPAGAAGSAGGLDFSQGPGILFNPHALANLPPQVSEGLKIGLAESLHTIFLVSTPLMVLALLLTLFLREIPLRKTLDQPEPSASPRLVAGVKLLLLSNAVKKADRDSSLLKAASGLISESGGSPEREKALQASEKVLKPLANTLLLTSLRENRPAASRITGYPKSNGKETNTGPDYKSP